MLYLPELDVLAALRRTAEIVRTDPHYIADWFGEQDPERLAGALRFFGGTQFGPQSIAPSFDQIERALPCISVMGGDGGTVEVYVDNYFGSEVSADGFHAASIIGERQRSAVFLDIAALNYEHAAFLKNFVKGALLFHRRNFDGLGLNEMWLSWKPLHIDQATLAQPIYRYMVVVDFRYNAQVLEIYGPAPEHIGTVVIDNTIPSGPDLTHDPWQMLTTYGTTAGTFALNWFGATTSPINWNAEASDVQSALAALPTIGAGNVTVSGGPLPHTPVYITFGGAISNHQTTLIGIDSSLLVGPKPMLCFRIAGS